MSSKTDDLGRGPIKFRYKDYGIILVVHQKITDYATTHRITGKNT